MKLMHFCTNHTTNMFQRNSFMEGAPMIHPLTEVDECSPTPTPCDWLVDKCVFRRPSGAGDPTVRIWGDDPTPTNAYR